MEKNTQLDVCCCTGDDACNKTRLRQQQQQQQKTGRQQQTTIDIYEPNCTTNVFKTSSAVYYFFNVSCAGCYMLLRFPLLTIQKKEEEIIILLLSHLFFFFFLLLVDSHGFTNGEILQQQQKLGRRANSERTIEQAYCYS